MNGWPLSSHDNLLPAHRSNPAPRPLIRLLLIGLLSVSASLRTHIPLALSDLSALAKKIKLEALASYHSNHQHGGINGENGDHGHGLGECPLGSIHTHTNIHGGCVGRAARLLSVHIWDAKSIRLEQLCLNEAD